MSRVGVIGAGTMGNGISQVFSQIGRDVVLADVAEEYLAKALKVIEKNARRVAKKKEMDEDGYAAEILGRITTATSLDALADCDLVVEAIVEDFGVKEKVLSEVDGIIGEGAILATNTSSISITKLAAVTSRPERVIGMHFMNPVPVMKLVEIIRGHLTSDETAAAVVDTVKELGKTPVEANDYPGFVANRILMPMINEAVYCMMEGVAAPEAIDEVMKLGMAHPMGPLALADLIGLDVCLSILEVLHRELGDSKYRPCPLLRRLVDAGLLGRKTGRGFYAY
ncbi:MAG: 3-hydroxybutyryl-CoA dehydrogenase [Planctomycetota bacterium]|jgi:3-hydroxybutyryl-CoA dehydrogenase